MKKSKMVAVLMSILCIGTMGNPVAVFGEDDFSIQEAVYVDVKDLNDRGDDILRIDKNNETTEAVKQESLSLAEATNSEDMKITVANTVLKAGETKDVPVNVSGNNGFAGFALTVSLPDGYTLNSISKGDILSSGTFTPDGANCTWYDSDNNKSNGILLKLSITASENAKDGQIVIGVKNGKANNLSDKLGQTVPAVFAAGTVSVEKEENSEDMRISTENVTLSPGVATDVSVSVNGNKGFAGFALTVRLPEGCTLNSITRGSIISDGTFSVDGANCSWYHSDNVKENGVLLTLNLTASENAKGGQITIDVKDGKANNLSDELGQTVSAVFAAGTITIAQSGTECAVNGHKGGKATCTRQAECSVCHQLYGELDPANHAGEKEVCNAVNATCAKEGYSGDTYCKECGKKIFTGTVIRKTAHTWDAGVITKLATADASGVKTFTCEICGETKTESIAYQSEVTPTPAPQAEKLSKPTGLSIKTSSSGIKLTWKAVKGADYYRVYRVGDNKTVASVSSPKANSYTNTKPKNGEKYTYYVQACSNNEKLNSAKSGNVTTVYLDVPKSLSAKSTAAKKAVITWKKNKKAGGYQIRYSLKSSMSGSKTVTIKKNATVKTTIGKLKSKKTYYFQIRSYIKTGSKIYYSAWSGKKKIKIK